MLFAGVCLVVAALAVVPKDVEVAFAAWAKKFGRTYASETERQTRLDNFYRATIQIAKLNAASTGANAARFGTNKFADWSEAELKSLRGIRGDRLTRNATREAKVMPNPIGQATCDWRTNPGVLAPIQNQEQCGSCWAFSATASLESAAAISSGSSYQKLSEQFLVDCDNECGTYPVFGYGCDQGCNGGLPPNAWQYVISQGGQPSESAYPYQGVQGTCQTGNPPITVPTGWEYAPTDETRLAAYVCANGPTSICVDASQWSYYQGGIMSGTGVCPSPTPASDLDHAVNLVGSGVGPDGTPYWIVRNSWDTDWGEAGYCQLIFGQNFCGLALFANRPTM